MLMLRLERISKRYKNHTALCNINFELATGDMAFLTGHSGAGKSTLLKLLLMIEKPTAGMMYINNKNCSKLSARNISTMRQDIGMIFQDPKLIPNRNIFENIALPLLISGYRMHEIKRRVRAVLEKVSLENKSQYLPHELSLGEQQRVGIARAIVHRPSLLLADEPTGNLDPSLSLEIMSLFAAFNAIGVTALIATHDLSLIKTMHKPVITLQQGALVS
jgi:cell division transport system ATP-binding protein